MTEPVVSTDRLSLRRFHADDAPFVLELLNEPSFKEFIGDKGVRTLSDACDYLEQGPLKSYTELGYGVYAVTCPPDGAPVGMCGLFKRDDLDHPDLGFAMLARHSGQGFATESSLAVIRHARDELGLPLLAAIVDPGNARSVALIGKLGFEDAGSYTIPGEAEALRYFEYRFGSEP